MSKVSLKFFEQNKRIFNVGVVLADFKILSAEISSTICCQNKFILGITFEKRGSNPHNSYYCLGRLFWGRR